MEFVKEVIDKRYRHVPGCVCMFVCLYAYFCVCVCVNASVYVFIYVYISVYLQVFMYVAVVHLSLLHQGRSYLII